MIDRRQPRAVYRQIADVYADQIQSGELGPGDRLPSVDLICRTYDVARATAQRALAELRAVGLIDTENGRVSRVRALPVLETGWLEPGATVSTRWPTPAEVRDETLGLAEGVPVLVVRRVGEPDQVLPGDRWQLAVPRPAAPRPVRGDTDG